MNYYIEYFCPNCNAILDNQPGFNPDDDIWECTQCGTSLYSDNLEKTMVNFEGVVWYCDSCDAILNKQSGFYDSCGTWYCTECGYANSITEDEIYESKSDYRSKKESCICPQCGNELENQFGFDNDDYWTCQICDAELYLDNTQYIILSSSTDDEYIDSEDTPFECNSCSSDVTNNLPTQIRTTQREKFQWKLKLCIFLIAFFTSIILIGYYEITKLIPVQYSASSFIGKNYEEVLTSLKEAGFTYISTENISDLDIKQASEEFQVTGVKIGWLESFDEEAKIPSNFPIVVTYHSLKMIQVPMSYKEVKGAYYKDIIKAFEDAGFVNIELVVEYDIITGWITSDGEVKSVVINGEKKFNTNDEFRPDAKIVITYHTLRKNKP